MKRTQVGTGRVEREIRAHRSLRRGIRMKMPGHGLQLHLSGVHGPGINMKLFQFYQVRMRDISLVKLKSNCNACGPSVIPHCDLGTLA